MGIWLAGDCELELLKFDHPEGRETFWHSRQRPSLSPLSSIPTNPPYNPPWRRDAALAAGAMYLSPSSLTSPSHPRIVSLYPSSRSNPFLRPPLVRAGRGHAGAGTGFRRRDDLTL